MFDEQALSLSGAGSINLPQCFDYVKSAEYRMPFAKLLGDSNKDCITVNCSGVTYIDSCGIGTLIAWHRNCEQQGKKLVIKNCSGRVMDIFKTLSVDLLFHLS